MNTRGRSACYCDNLLWAEPSPIKYSIVHIQELALLTLEGEKGIFWVPVIHCKEAQKDRHTAGPSSLLPILNATQLTQ